MLSGKAEEILNYVKEKGKEDNLEIRLNYSKMATWNGKDISSGYFDDPQSNEDLEFPLLAVGIDKEESQWLEVLLHEFNHYLQWKNKTESWNKYVDLYKDYDDGDEETFEMIEATVNMEAECEKNTITLSEELNYDINKERYIKKVNAYLVFYQIYFETKRWYKIPPFENDKVLDMMPSKVIDKPMLFPINKDLRDLYIKSLT